MKRNVIILRHEEDIRLSLEAKPPHRCDSRNLSPHGHIREDCLSGLPQQIGSLTCGAFISACLHRVITRNWIQSGGLMNEWRQVGVPSCLNRTRTASLCKSRQSTRRRIGGGQRTAYDNKRGSVWVNHWPRCVICDGHVLRRGADPCAKMSPQNDTGTFSLQPERSLEAIPRKNTGHNPLSTTPVLFVAF